MQIDSHHDSILYCPILLKVLFEGQLIHRRCQASYEDLLRALGSQAVGLLAGRMVFLGHCFLGFNLA